MLTILGLALLFVILLILPFAVSMLSQKKSREAALYVKNDNVRDPRYFSNSFRYLVENGINRENRTVQMSKLEPYLLADELTGNACGAIVIAETRFRPLGIAVFSKEIYAAASARIPEQTYLRAIACLDELELLRNCSVIRWADSEKQMIVHPGCMLGINASSAERLRIAPGCTFRRLYAPEILIGLETVSPAHQPVDMTVYTQRWIDAEFVEPQSVVKKTIVSEFSLDIGEGAVVMGSLKSTHNIYLHKNARVNGNVIADGLLILDEGARILGTAFSQDSILVGPEAEIGVPPRIKSLIARKFIMLCETARVYGYVGCEVDSVTIAKENFQLELRHKRWASRMTQIKNQILQEKFDRRKASAAKTAAEDAELEEEVDSLFE